jgi:GntR family transcriptional regulator / MocR family aminotransferase
VAFERDVVQRALARGVRVGRLSGYFLGRPTQTGLVLGYGAIAEGRIDEGLRRLRACLAAAARG